MKRSKKPIRATYRPATWLEEGLDLQKLLKDCWKKKPKILDRAQSFEGNITLLSSPLKTYGACSCIQLRIIEKGRRQIAVKLGDEIDDLADIEVEPPSDNDEFVQDSFHAAIVGNHVAFCGSPLISPNKFRDYLSWLFREAHGENPPGGGEFGFVDIPSQEGLQKMMDKSISKVRIGGAVGAKETVTSEETKRKHVVRRVDPRGRSFPRAVIEWMKSSGYADDIPDLSQIDQTRLTVSLEIGFDRVEVDSDQQMLRDMAAMDVVDGDGNKAVSVELKGGTKIKPDLLVVKETFNVEAFNGNVPRETYFQELSSWLKTLGDKKVLVT